MQQNQTTFAQLSSQQLVEESKHCDSSFEVRGNSAVEPYSVIPHSVPRGIV